MSVIVLDDQVVHYEVLGRGLPVVFLHGWIGSWRYWIPAMQGVSISFRAYALDWWGFGDTAKDAAHYSLEGQLRLLDGFLGEMGIQRCALAGHGLGAVLALRYARMKPEAVDRVMAVSLPLELNALNPRLRGSSLDELIEWAVSKEAALGPVRSEMLKTDPRALQSTLDELSQDEFHSLVLDGQTSLMLVHGQNDPLVQEPPEEQVAGLPEYAHALVFEQSGHFPMLEESSKFNRLLIEFLSLKSGESPRQLQLKEEWKRRVR